MPQRAAPPSSGLMRPLVVLALPGMYLLYKYNQYRQQQMETARRRVTERELMHLNTKIVSFCLLIYLPKTLNVVPEVNVKKNCLRKRCKPIPGSQSNIPIFRQTKTRLAYLCTQEAQIKNTYVQQSGFAIIIISLFCFHQTKMETK